MILIQMHSLKICFYLLYGIQILRVILVYNIKMSNRILQFSIFVFIAVLVTLLIKTPSSETQSPRNQISVIKQLNNKTADVLHDLVRTKFFRLIRLNLNANCPIPYMQKICKSKSCSVCRCDEKDIPQNWVRTDKVKSTDKDKDVWSQERETKQGRWVWHVEDEENDKGQYFDVNSNVQSFSGYNGSYIWKLIYEDNCFKGANHLSDMCLEQQVLYNIISGLHTSISSHLSRLYKNVTEASIWADKGDESFFFNHKEYNQRVVQHPQRIKNMLFLYEMLIRSVQQLIPYLETHQVISSDNIAEDMQATKLMNQLVQEIKKIKFKPLNETDASFFVENNPHVKQYQRYIHNISNILNCVDCQKCRLFGKMQTYGLGTALKILLGYNTQYKRNEIVAMFNALNKISISVNTFFNYEQFLSEGIYGNRYKPINYTIVGLPQESNQEDSLHFVRIWSACGFVMLLFIWIITNWSPKDKVQRQFKHAFPPKQKTRRE